MKRVL
ncbi:hypothetical protein VTL71DRAFT_15919 [Oculimacula yallundae]